MSYFVLHFYSCVQVQTTFGTNFEPIFPFKLFTMSFARNSEFVGVEYTF